MKKIYIAGGMYGKHNIGDEAILESTIDSFSDICKLTVSSNNEEWIKKRYPMVKVRKIECIYARSILGMNIYPRSTFFKKVIKREKEKRFIYNIDGFICGGGTVLSDCPWHAMTLVEYATRFKKNVILWGSGIADTNDRRTEDYLKNVLNNNYVKGIFVRDEFVKSRLEKLGVVKNKIKVCYDPAIIIDGHLGYYEKYLKDFQIKSLHEKKINFAFSISGESDVFNKTPFKEILKIVYRLSLEYDCNIYFLASGCGDDGRDLEIIKKLKKEINLSNVYYIEKELDPNSMVQFLKNIDIVISSRLHINIFSACGGNTQFVGLVRNSKIIDFSNIMRQPYIKMEDISEDVIITSIHFLIKNKVKNIEWIRTQVEKMRKQYNIMLNEAYSLLKLK